MLCIQSMHDLHLASLDLNLLVVLEALIDTGSVTASAERLRLSQSATSHALARLRSALGDPLFVRGRAGLVPTDRVLAIAGPLRDALARVREAVAPAPAFEPKTSERRFLVRTGDYAELVLVPRLAARLAQVAPRVDLWLSPGEGDALDDLARGDIDVFLAPRLPQFRRADVRERKLFDERFVSVVRRGHPRARAGWTVAEFAALDHAFVAPSGRPGGTVDDVLTRHGLSRRVAVQLPHFLAAPFIVAETDLVLTIPARVAMTFASSLPLRMIAPPVALEGFTMSLMWHERRHHDPAHAWFRNEVAATAAALREPPKR
jgi:DNA-binding transcriptional LysR family regulator